MTPLDCWMNFFENEKLTPSKVHPTLLYALAQKLAEIEHPKRSPYRARLASRRILCLTAMEMGIDLAALRHRGKLVMSRGLLDAWNLAYQEKYGSNYGTSGVKEATRRTVKTKVLKELKDDTARYGSKD